MARRWRLVSVGVLALFLNSCSDTTVTAVEVSTLNVSPSQATVEVGDSLQLQAETLDESGNILPDRPVVWRSDDAGIATVEGGLVRGVASGTVLIRALSGSASGRSVVTVRQESSILLSEDSLVFQGMSGSIPTEAQQVGISNGGDVPLSGLQANVSYLPDEPAGWLQAVLAGTTAPTELSVEADPSNLLPGVHRAALEVTAADADIPPRVIEIIFEVGEALPVVQVAPQAVGFSVAEGEGVPGPQVVQVTNGGGRELTGLEARISYDEGQPDGWLVAELARTSAPTELTLRVDPSGLVSPAAFDAVVEVTSPGAASPGRVFVRFTLGAPPPAIELTPSLIEWDIVENDPLPPSREVNITNSGTGTLGGLSVEPRYWWGPVGLWLRTSVTPTVAPAVVSASLSNTSLPPGNYEGRILVRSSDANNSPQSVVVFLRVAPRASPEFSTITQSPSSVVADGAETSTITVQLKDARGDDMPSGGDRVEIFTTLGTLSPVSDRGDGTYTATLRSTEAGAASITASVNSDPIDDAATVEFVAGPPEDLEIVTGDDQTGTVGEPLGEPLQVRVTDGAGNAVAGLTVTWTPAADDGVASPTESLTDASGIASTRWTLGSAPGGQSLTVSAGAAGEATFTATAEVGLPAEVEIVSGDAQTGTVAEPLREPLRVRVTDEVGNPVSGVTVNWTPRADDGVASPTASQTNDSGIASTTWTLGSAPGGQSLTASAGAAGEVPFNATAEAGPPEQLDIVSGDGQIGVVVQALSDPLQVRVTDGVGNPVSGVTVTWTPAAGDGSAGPTASQTDASGIASTTWTLGSSAGAQSLTASAGTAGTATFNATAEAGPPEQLDIVSGDGQTATVGEPLGDQLQVRVTDGEGNPVAGATVTWTPSGDDGVASPTVSQTDAGGIASTAWTLGSSPGGQSLTASAGTAGTVTFNATANPAAPGDFDR